MMLNGSNQITNKDVNFLIIFLMINICIKKHIINRLNIYLKIKLIFLITCRKYK